MGLVKNLTDRVFGKSWERYLLRRMGAIGEPLDSDSRAFTGDSDYLEAMRRSTWVYAACGAIADNFCRPRWWFEKATGKQKQREVDIPELSQLLRRPTPYHTGAELFEATVIHLLLTGKAFWYLSEMTALSMFETTYSPNGKAAVALDEAGKPKLKNPTFPIAAGKPKEIWYLRPDCVTPVVGAKGKLFDHFVYEPSPGVKYDIPAEAMIYFRRFDPTNMTEGLGVIEAASTTLEADQRAADWNRRFFKNSARPDFVLGTDQELTAEQITRYSAEWKTNFGGQDRAHRVAFLGGGIKPIPFSIAQADMDFINLRKFGREEILAMFRVPPAKVGIFEYANYANAKEQDKIFWGECMEPIMRRFADKLTAELVSRYDAQAAFAFEDMTPTDLELQSRIATALIGNGVWSPNEARQQLGLGEEYDGGDRYYVPMTFVPVSDFDNPIYPSAPAGQGPEETPSSSDETGEDGQGENSSETPNAEDSPEKQNTSKILTLPDSKAVRHARLLRPIRRLFGDEAKRQFQAQQGVIIPAMASNEALAELIDAGQRNNQGTIRKIAQRDVSNIVAQLTDWQGVNGRFGKAMEAKYKAAISLVGPAALAELGIDLDFNVGNPHTIAFLKSYIPKLAGGVTEETRGLISGAIKAGIENAESLSQIQDRVRDVFSGCKEFRAENIARSETARATTKGDIAAWQQSGVVEGKIWRLGPDPCPFCEEMAGNENALMDNFFDMGDTLEKGGDTWTCDYTPVDGPPLHPACVCWLEAVLKPVGG